jgi:hypothetical protein
VLGCASLVLIFLCFPHDVLSSSFSSYDVIRSVVPGEPLFSDEAPADCMYFIVDGRVELTERARTKPLRGSFDAPKYENFKGAPSHRRGEHRERFYQC